MGPALIRSNYCLELSPTSPLETSSTLALATVPTTHTVLPSPASLTQITCSNPVAPGPAPGTLSPVHLTLPALNSGLYWFFLLECPSSL